MLPLEGITVVSLEHAIAAPFATRQLADLGARVIKVERPLVGDFARSYDQRVNGLASHFVWANRSKESLTLDLKQSGAANILHQLLTEADVLVQNLAPGAAARMGLSYTDLQTINPRLIVCNVSGYGEGGPYQNRKAYDLLIQAEAGFISTTGTTDSPSKAGISIADIAAGMYAYSNILAALIQRGISGQGCNIDVSMLEAMTEWMGFPLYYAYDGAAPPNRAGASHATIFPYGPFVAGDGNTVLFGLQNEREWTAFCKLVLQKPALVEDPRFTTNSLRVKNKKELTDCIVSGFSHLSAMQVIERLESAGIANSQMRDMADVWTHPQLEHRKRWRQINTSAGLIPALIPPGGVGPEPRMDPVPALGEHTSSILTALNYTPEQISALQQKQAI
ncbi:MAG: CoA transferase [Oceanospirillaceae bacterium]|jgi:itaconate CoA-transferase|nr:CoA transferase [Oceanospirillaceae bacterium]